MPGVQALFFDVGCLQFENLDSTCVLRRFRIKLGIKRCLLRLRAVELRSSRPEGMDNLNCLFLDALAIVFESNQFLFA